MKKKKLKKKCERLQGDIGYMAELLAAAIPFMSSTDLRTLDEDGEREYEMMSLISKMQSSIPEVK